VYNLDPGAVPVFRWKCQPFSWCPYWLIADLVAASGWSIQ
jgi:hypothetical protein